MRAERWMTAAAIGTWLVCGLQPLVEIANRQVAAWPALLWSVSFVSFGVALITLLFRPHGFPAPAAIVALAVVQSVTGLAMTYLTATYFRGSGVSAAALVIVAAELPYIVRPGWAWSWVAAQTVALTALSVAQAGPALLFSIAMAFGGFQAFAVTSSLLTRNEAAARRQLAVINTELLATRALLAESSRVDERLRIARDLHDTLGHHLTALSLQLDVASRLTDGKAAEHVGQAHAVTRLLLADVRDVVSSLRETGRMDLAQAIRALATPQAGVSIHLDLPPALGVDDVAVAETIVRCVQEIITNTVRHAGARNLWIRLGVGAEGISLESRDDGRGAGVIALGHGLTGMRERFERHGGRVDFVSSPADGFEVRGFLPLPVRA